MKLLVNPARHTAAETLHSGLRRAPLQWRCGIAGATPGAASCLAPACLARIYSAAAALWPPWPSAKRTPLSPPSHPAAPLESRSEGTRLWRARHESCKLSKKRRACAQHILVSNICPQMQCLCKPHQFAAAKQGRLLHGVAADGLQPARHEPQHRLARHEPALAVTRLS